ncbi:hypothetical protein WJX79_003838 [Trebouxia sp. C0005]
MVSAHRHAFHGCPASTTELAGTPTQLSVTPITKVGNSFWGVLCAGCQLLAGCAQQLFCSKKPFCQGPDQQCGVPAKVGCQKL